MRRSDANVPFEDLRALLVRLGFDERARGDHHIFTMSGVEEILNFQPRSGKAKPYQVKLAGCMADGKTYQEALANAEVVIKEWIETARELGRAVPEPRGRLAYA